MNVSGYGYLAKLKAVEKLAARANSGNVARFLGVGYETARSAMRRLEAAKYLTAARTETGRFRPEITYTLTEKGRKAILAGVEPVIPTHGYIARPVQRSPLDEPAAVQWEELHTVLGMGQPVVVPEARVVRFQMDRERWPA